MNYDKDVQFVFRGNMTRTWIHLLGKMARKSVFNVQWAWPSSNTLSTMVHGQAFRII